MKTSAAVLVLLSALTFVASSSAGSSQDSAGPDGGSPSGNHMTLNVSVFYPLSMSKNDRVSTNINLSWLYGKVGAVDGVDLSGWVSQVGRDAHGLQATGIVGLVANNMQGFQAAGVYNYVGSTVEGAQAAGVYNRAGGDVSLVQAAGIINTVGGDFEGIQAAGVVNVLRGKLTGLQASTVNLAGDVDGVQVCVVNTAGRVRGFQVGVVNIARSIDGIPIGLVNYAEEGTVHPVVWGSNMMLTNLGAKFAVNEHFYSVFSVGHNNQSEDVGTSLALGYAMGVHLPVQSDVYVDIDLGGLSIDNDELFRADKGVKNQSMLQARLTVGYELVDKLSIFGGIGQNYVLDHDEAFSDGDYRTQLLAGLQLL